jgi:uncharacterized repeat protein (TIGR01451 family)
LADVFEVHVDPAGGANVTWTKDLGSRAIYFACQNTGASAFAGAPNLNGCYGPADLSLAKVDTPDPVLQGQNLTYHLAVTNNGTASGPSTTSGVKVTDTLPSGVTLVSATPSTGSCSGTTTIVCTLGVLAGGAIATVDVVVVAPTTSGTLTNTASVAATSSDPNTTNNTATATTTVAPAADVSITKVDTPDPVHAGKNITYTIGVANAGPAQATAVTVKDTLPSTEEFRSIKTSQGKCTRSGQAITCSLGTIASGRGATITLVAKAKTAGGVTNTATASAAEGDPDAGNNSATATTTVSR